MNNGWDEYKVYILNELKDLKDSAKKQDEDHARVREALADLKVDLQGFKTHQKWELRILSGVWGLIVMGLNAIIGSHGK